MKARKKNLSDEWKEIEYVQLEDSDILYKQEYLEFDNSSTDLKTNEQIANETHWQDIRERAAIVALSGMLANINITGDVNIVAQVAVNYADALIEKLKKK